MKVQIDQIKHSLKEGEIKDALELLHEGTQNTTFEIESTLLISRYNKLNKEKNSNIIDEDAAERESNKIVISALELLNNITDSFFHDEVNYEGLLFYETPQEINIPKNERSYHIEFDKNQVRQIAWELNMKYPKLTTSINFTVEWSITKPDGQVVPKITCDFFLQKDWIQSWISSSWGYKDFGKLESGRYIYEIYIRDKLVSKGDFSVR